MIRISSMQRLDTTSRYFDRVGDGETGSDYDTCMDGSLSRNCSFVTSMDGSLSRNCSFVVTTKDSSEETTSSTTTGPSPSWYHEDSKQQQLKEIREPRDEKTTTTTTANDDDADDSRNETTRLPESSRNLLDSLSDDVTILAFSFLSVSDLGSLSSTSRRNFETIRGSDALWWDLMPWQGFQRLRRRRRIRFRVDDRYRLGRFLSHGLTAPSWPTELDTATNERCENNKFREFAMTASSKCFPEPKSWPVVVQFAGRVRTGDRCLRADRPFPTVARGDDGDGGDSLDGTKKKRWSAFSSCVLHITNKVNNRSNGGDHRSDNNNNNEPRPFVSPLLKKLVTVADDPHPLYVFDVAPRLFAYFEVTLLARDVSQEPPVDDDDDVGVVRRNVRDGTDRRYRHYTEDEDEDDEDEDDDFLHVAPRRLPLRRPSTEMIAVGLSSSRFCPDDRMPGWDRHSYGYHGDDGGVFHSDGDMLRRYGPGFGPGDTVGCGIDFSCDGIFFTLNGEFLGFAWTNVDLSEPLWPTVGVDARSPVAVNFGGGEEGPFAFDTDVMADADEHADAVGRWLSSSSSSSSSSGFRRGGTTTGSDGKVSADERYYE